MIRCGCCGYRTLQSFECSECLVEFCFDCANPNNHDCEEADDDN